MANDQTTHGRRPRSSAPADRARKRTLAATAGAIPLAISMLSGSISSKPPKPPVAARAVHHSAGDFSGLEFNPGCRLPFDGNAIPAIDDECSIDGAGTTDAKKAESRAKNDFCENPSSVVPIQYDTFLQLQQKTRIKVKADRSPLAKILPVGDTTVGEGTVVEYVGFLLHAQYSNKSSGEAVNCNIPGMDTNDIHIQLVNVDTPQEDDACKSVTAQMSPHFRPETWTPDQLNSVRSHLLRIRGPLFYDGSHTPCHDDKRPNPQRASVWEIHPVYSVDVCKQKGGATCDSWIPLEEWNGVESSEDEEE
jgi:hypothetical protein